MYNEFRNTNREGWRYSCAGGALLEFARAKLAYHTDQELAARRTVQARIADPTISRKDDELQKAEKAIDEHGNLREQCAVFVHEFARTPDREFQLSLGDVVFFGIVDAAPGGSSGG